MLYNWIRLIKNTYLRKTKDKIKEVKDKYNLQYYVNPKLGEELYGIGMAYDFCIEKSTTDIFMIFHADMMLGKNADLNTYKQLKSKSVATESSQTKLQGDETRF